ncbi:flagellar biosynthesis protein FliQ [Candidatus Poribacteria bacterium]|nr:flagellar biosynthesis protein FliQ [Candidatus Poribacteria bacterium]
MSLELVTTIVREAFLTAMLVSAPVLGTALVVGLLVSILQAITQIHELTLTFIPKILAITAVLLLLLPWVLQVLVTYTVTVFRDMNLYLDTGIVF